MRKKGILSRGKFEKIDLLPVRTFLHFELATTFLFHYYSNTNAMIRYTPHPSLLFNRGESVKKSSTWFRRKGGWIGEA